MRAGSKLSEVAVSFQDGSVRVMDLRDEHMQVVVIDHRIQQGGGGNFIVTRRGAWALLDALNIALDVPR